jgi:hypothetical protein
VTLEVLGMREVEAAWGKLQEMLEDKECVSSCRQQARCVYFNIYLQQALQIDIIPVPPIETESH